jgi:hypothetical protein
LPSVHSGSSRYTEFAGYKAGKSDRIHAANSVHLSGRGVVTGATVAGGGVAAAAAVVVVVVVVVTAVDFVLPRGWFWANF